MAERTLYQSAPVMRLYIAEHPFHYEMENLCRIFFPYHRIETIPCGTDGNGAHILDYGTLGAYTGMQTELGGIRLQARLFFGGRERIAEERTSLSFPGDLKELERRLSEFHIIAIRKRVYKSVSLCGIRSGTNFFHCGIRNIASSFKIIIMT